MTQKKEGIICFHCKNLVVVHCTIVNGDNMKRNHIHCSKNANLDNIFITDCSHFIYDNHKIDWLKERK